MNQISYWLVLLSLVTSNIYIVDSYTLTASVLNQLGYNTQYPFISIEDNNIDSIDLNAFNGYNALDSIRITTNKMLSLDLEPFKYAANITVLFLNLPSLNKFTNTKNVKLPYLTSLLLYSNLTSLNKPMFNAFPALRNFRTGEYTIGYSNNLKTIDVHTFESLSNLLNLNLQLCSITGFEYLQIPKNLKTLNLAGNNMNYFALSRTMGVLDYLDISYNRFRSFKSMDFTFLANLTQLDLYNNPHAYPYEISGHMKPLVKLERVDLRNLSINSIDSNFFKTNPDLKYIDLANNKISSLDIETFNGMTKLETLLLYSNNLTKIITGTFNNSNILTIQLAGNRISHLEESAFYGYQSKPRVYLSSNQLTKITPRTFINAFTEIIIQSNQITEIENTTFDGLNEVGSLMLSINRITKMASGSFKNIKIDYFDVGMNFLTELKNSTFIGTIDTLYLGFNALIRIEEGALNYVTITNSIALNSNRLTEINSTMFAGQKQLKIIYLGDNMLSKIEPGSFANLPNLNYVYLQNNQLSQLDSSIFAGSDKLIGIYLKDNPIVSTTSAATLQTMLCPPAATNCQVITN